MYEQIRKKKNVFFEEEYLMLYDTLNWKWVYVHTIMTNERKFDVVFTNFNTAKISTTLNAQHHAYFSNILQVTPFSGKSILHEQTDTPCNVIY